MSVSPSTHSRPPCKNNSSYLHGGMSPRCSRPMTNGYISFQTEFIAGFHSLSAVRLFSVMAVSTMLS